MILLRNLMLALAAFVVSGVGFYAFLLHRMPPDQLPLQETAIEVPARQAAGGGEPGNVVARESSESSSSFSLLTAVISDFVDASRSGAAAEAAKDQAAFEARYKVPDWLNQRFEQEASAAGKAISSLDKSTLLATLLELRQMKYDQMNAPADSQTTAGGDVSNWALTTRAMQAELQFRQILGVGLAEFMKKLEAEELQQLLALPLDQSPPKETTSAATQTGTALIR